MVTIRKFITNAIIFIAHTMTAKQAQTIIPPPPCSALQWYELLTPNFIPVVFAKILSSIFAESDLEIVHCKFSLKSVCFLADSTV